MVCINDDEYIEVSIEDLLTDIQMGEAIRREILIDGLVFGFNDNPIDPYRIVIIYYTDWRGINKKCEIRGALTEDIETGVIKEVRESIEYYIKQYRGW